MPTPPATARPWAGSTGRSTDDGVTYCFLSPQVLVLGWSPAAARELDVPEVTVVELYLNSARLTELREALRHVFDHDTPDRPRLAIDPDPAVVGEWLPLFDL